MTPEKIKPCPFCGGIALFTVERDAYDFNHYWLQCLNCHGYAIADTADQAVEKWNKGEIHYAK